MWFQVLTLAAVTAVLAVEIGWLSCRSMVSHMFF
jgi:hypothetical protein